MPFTPTPQAVTTRLREMHPDPFTQAAILRVYQEAPGLLTNQAVMTLQDAHATPTGAPEALPVQEN